MTDTLAALITGRGSVEFRPFGHVPPPPGCVTVELALCGICGTEISSFRSGHLHSPAVCGHEWTGRVVAAGAGVTSVSEGDSVVACAPNPCGRCPECERGMGEYCRSVSNAVRGRDEFAPPHGGFAPRITLSAGRVMRAHPGLREEEAAQVEPASVAFHGVRRSNIRPGDLVVVQGAGPIGQLAAQFARAAGAGQTVVVEPDATRRALATELGATHAFAPEEAVEQIAELTGGVLADVVLECSGVAALLQTALELTRHGGTVGLLSFLADRPSLDAAGWLAKQTSVVASNAFTREDVRRSMAMLADGRVRALPLVSRTIGLADLESTLQELSAAATADVKVLVDVQSSPGDGAGQGSRA